MEVVEFSVSVAARREDGSFLIALLVDGEAKEHRCVGIISCGIEAARQLRKVVGSVLETAIT